MKLLIALAIFAVVVNGAAQFNGLFGGTGTIAVTATNVDTSSGYVIVVTAKPTSYVADGTAAFAVELNVTWTGVLPAGVPPTTAWMTVTGPGSVYNPDGGAVCDSAALNVFSLGGGSRTADNLWATYDASLSFRLTAAGTYTASISLKDATPVTFTFTVSTFYTPPTAGARPTISAFNLVPTSTSSDLVTALTANLTNVLAEQQYIVSVVFTAGTPQGVAWVSTCVVTIATGATVGYCNTFGDLTPFVGGWCGDKFLSDGSLTGVDYPEGTALTVRSVTVTVNDLDGAGYFSNSFGASASFLAGNNVLTVSNGDADKIAPTCSAIAFATNAVQTNNIGITPVVTTITCVDNMGGSGVNLAVAVLSGPAGEDDQLVLAAPVANTQVGQTSIFLYQTYNVVVKGVGAIDGAGNAVFYGSCGTYAGGYSTVCAGTSSSSTIVASFALVVMCIMALLAL